MSRRETRPRKFSDLSISRDQLISAGSRSIDRYDPKKLELLKKKYEY